MRSPKGNDRVRLATRGSSSTGPVGTVNCVYSFSMLADDPERELWDPRVQAIEPSELAGLAADGLRREWERVWQLPLPFYRAHYERAGLRVDDVPALDEIPRTTKANLRDDETDFPPFG